MAKSGRPKTNTSAAVSTDSEVKTTGPVEQGKPEVKEETTAAETPKEEPKEEKAEAAEPMVFAEKTYTVTNKDKAGKKITGSSGTVIVFDENGIAKVGMKDAEHLSRVPGYSVTE